MSRQVQVIEIIRRAVTIASGPPLATREARVAFQNDLHLPVAGEEGAPSQRGFGSFPPASEREARMDDPRSGHA